MIKILKIVTKPIIELKNIIGNIVIFWPDTAFGSKLRNSFYKKRLRSIGQNVVIESGVRFGQPDRIDIGNNCLFGRNVNVNAGNCKGVFLGNDIALAEGTYLRSSNHSFRDLGQPILNQGHFAKTVFFNNKEYSVVIENDVWVGAHCILLSGTHIGTGSVIGAGARISGYIPPYSIVVGNPGVIVGNRIEKYGTVTANDKSNAK
jgi:acetyltransferase-like isoleucine patch superfamily enzyme